MTLQTIVCHVDLSSRSRAGARVASALADRLDAELVLVHADELPGLASHIAREPGHPSRRATPRVALDHELSLRRQLSELSRELEEIDAVSPKLELLRQRSVDGFLEYVDDKDADLIVVGADEPSVVRRLLHRSVTESVARRAPCPVLALAGNADDHRPMDHIMVAVDYSPQSYVEAQLATQLLREGAKLSLIHVCPAGALDSEPAAGARELGRLRQFAVQLDLRMFDVALYVDRGDPATRIAERADELGVDAVVVGSHPHHGWRDRLLGTMADRILERVDCSVLAVPMRAIDPPTIPAMTAMDTTLAESFPASDPPPWWAGAPATD